MNLALIGGWMWGCTTPTPSPSPTCGSCHPVVQAQWEASHHARAERKVTPSDTWAADAVRIIGVDPLEQAVFESDGRWRVDPLARDTRDGSRFSVLEGAPTHWQRDGGLVWNGQCAECHNTGVSIGLAPDGTYDTRVEAIGVTCAACHGSSKAHMDEGVPTANARMEDTCLSCHTRRTSLTGRFRPGDRYLDHFEPLTVAHPDFGVEGRALGEVFEGNAFLSSPMHAAGARCVSCHDPHSGAVLVTGDAGCTSCHAGHGAVGTCVECHMPTTTVMNRHVRRDHAFVRSEPSAQSLAFERARSGGPLGNLDLEPRPRGRHAAVMELLAGRPEGLSVLRRRLTHPDPWVRAAAAGALSPVDETDIGRLRTASQDPVRAVRVAAQRQLARSGEPLDGLADLLKAWALNADQPDILAERGLLRVRGGDPTGLSDLRRAVLLDPDTEAWWMWSGVASATLGRHEEAIGLLTAGLDRLPASTALLHARALERAAVGDRDGAFVDVRAVLQIDPNHPGARRSLSRLTKGPAQTILHVPSPSGTP